MVISDNIMMEPITGSEYVKDDCIIWPSVVVVMTDSLLKKDENGKLSGVENQELLDKLSYWGPVDALHTYCPEIGHLGMNILIFESSFEGYLKAKRLDDYFRLRIAHREQQFSWVPQIYGYLANKSDLDWFNERSVGSPKLKYELRPYQEIVGSNALNANKEELQTIHVAREAREGSFESLQQDVSQKEKLMKIHENERAARNQRHSGEKSRLANEIRRLHAEEKNAVMLRQLEDDSKLEKSNLNKNIIEKERAALMHRYNAQYPELEKKYMEMMDEYGGQMLQRHREEVADQEKFFDDQLNHLIS